MKLVQAHIENFGKLHQQDFTFEDGLNVICEENGWGKSTLAAFLKIMLFGFSGEKTRDPLQKERKRFAPWQGGNYGGWLTVSVQGRLYRIQRSFGSKEKEDVLEIRDEATNILTDYLGSNPGEKLFQIDRESFEKTVFISQNDCEGGVTDSVHAKIGNLNELTDDINAFEGVRERLNNTLNALSPSRKTGELYRLKEEIAGDKAILREQEDVAIALQRYQEIWEEQKARGEQLKQDRSVLERTLQELSNRKDLQGLALEYLTLWESEKERKEALEGVQKALPEELPTEGEIERQREDFHKLQIDRETLMTCNLSAEEKTELDRYDAEFSGQCWNPETNRKVSSLTGEIQELIETWRKLSGLGLREEEEERFAEIEKFFKGEVPSREELTKLLSDWNLRCEYKNARGLHETTLELREEQAKTARTLLTEQIRKAKKKKQMQGLCCLLAGLGLICAGFFFLSQNVVAGLAGLSIGGLITGIGSLGLAGLIGRRQGKMDKPDDRFLPEEERLQNLRQEIEEQEKIIRGIEKKVHDFLREYEYSYDEYMVLTDLQEIKGMTEDYSLLLARKKDGESSVQKQKALLQEQNLREELAVLVGDSAFQLSLESVLALLYETERKQNRYCALKEKLETNSVLMKEISEIESRWEEFQNRYVGDTWKVNRPDEILTMLSNGRVELGRAREEHRKAEEKIMSFAQNCDVSLELLLEIGKNCKQNSDDEQSLEEVQEKLRQLNGELEILTEKRRESENRLEELLEKQGQLQERESLLQSRQEELMEGLERYSLIQKTKEYLEKAKMEFTARYMEPLMKGFQKYYAFLTGDEGTDYHLDANLQLTVEKEGMWRDVHFLSAGYQDLVGLSYRMALTDAMYPEEKPFLIADDPFVNLDDRKRQGGSTFLKKVSGEYQILYFTCREEEYLPRKERLL